MKNKLFRFLAIFAIIVVLSLTVIACSPTARPENQVTSSTTEPVIEPAAESGVFIVQQAPTHKDEELDYGAAYFVRGEDGQEFFFNAVEHNGSIIFYFDGAKEQQTVQKGLSTSYSGVEINTVLGDYPTGKIVVTLEVGTFLSRAFYVPENGDPAVYFVYSGAPEGGYYWTVENIFKDSATQGDYVLTLTEFDAVSEGEGDQGGGFGVFHYAVGDSFRSKLLGYNTEFTITVKEIVIQGGKPVGVLISVAKG